MKSNTQSVQSPAAQHTLGPEDVIIAVMGITGSGKSSFINLLVEEDVGVGHDLKSCTTAVQIYTFENDDGRKVYLIDTPGFDDTNRPDIEVLKDVALFLSQTYRRHIQLTGIVYLQKITDNKMSGSSVRNLSMFKRLCGESVYPHIVLATTMWSHVERSPDLLEQAERREEELTTSDDWWGLMQKRGSQVVRHTGEPESALSIINGLIDARNPQTKLDIQRELVDDNLSLDKTGAGREAEKETRKVRERLQKELKDVQNSHKAALKDRDQQMAEKLKEQHDTLQSQIKDAAKAQQELKVNFARLQEEKVAKYKRLNEQLLTKERNNEGWRNLKSKRWRAVIVGTSVLIGGLTGGVFVPPV